MGKIIICNGEVAKKPYHMKLANTNVYSIEELCYYINVNLDMIEAEHFTESLAYFIKDELKLSESGERLLNLIKNKAALKDLLVCILCSCDYYTETEIKQMIRKLDAQLNLSPFEKRKRRGDQYLQQKKYNKAREEYEKILYGKETFAITNAQYGIILHNLGVIKLNTEGIRASLMDFKEAYNRSRNYNSLKLYILGLKLTGQEDKIEEALIEYKLKQDALDEMYKELEVDDKNIDTPFLKIRGEILAYKENTTELYQKVEELFKLLKEDYRLENA